MKSVLVARDEELILSTQPLLDILNPDHLHPAYFLNKYSSFPQLAAPRVRLEDTNPQDALGEKSLVKMIPSRPPNYNIKASLAAKAPHRFQSIGELNSGAYKKVSKRCACGRETYVSAQVRSRKISQGYIRKIVATTAGGAMWEEEWMPQNEEEEEAVQLLSMGEPKKDILRGCRKCGNIRMTAKWCPCQNGQTVTPSDLIPGKYSLLVIKGKQAGTNAAPPVLKCKSCGSNLLPKIQAQCKDYLRSIGRANMPMDDAETFMSNQDAETFMSHDQYGRGESASNEGGAANGEAFKELLLSTYLQRKGQRRRKLSLCLCLMILEITTMMDYKPMTVLEMAPMIVQTCLLCRLKGCKPMTVLRVLEMAPMTVQACLLC
jgi:hypothetical protein